ncbi:hypothetical protein PGB90_008222 [Kerria lacca]
MRYSCRAHFLHIQMIAENSKYGGVLRYIQCDIQSSYQYVSIAAAILMFSFSHLRQISSRRQRRVAYLRPLQEDACHRNAVALFTLSSSDYVIWFKLLAYAVFLPRCEQNFMAWDCFS